MRLGIVVLGTFLLNACSVPHKTTSMTATSGFNPVIAHRGAFKKNGFPENSIASLREAIRLGCAGSEFDVRMTADDSLVINHDPHFGGKDIEKHSYAELSAQLLSNGEKLPTLRQYLLEGIANNPHTRLIMEIKASPNGTERGELIAARSVAMVRECGATAITEYISFDFAILKKILSIDPAAITHYLNGEKTPAELKQEGIRGMDYNYSVYQKNPNWVAAAKAAGIVLNVWTVNDAAKLDWCLQQGFDFITTNEPELLLQMVKQH